MRQLQLELMSAQQEQDAAVLEALTSQMANLAAQKQNFEPPKSPYFRDSRDEPGYMPGR